MIWFVSFNPKNQITQIDWAGHTTVSDHVIVDAGG
jgi:hypothetical protein